MIRTGWFLLLLAVVAWFGAIAAQAYAELVIIERWPQERDAQLRAFAELRMARRILGWLFCAGVVFATCGGLLLRPLWKREAE